MSAAIAPVPHAPLGESGRLPAMDVLRGFALLGIFMVNMQLFAMTFSEFIAPSIGAESPRSDVLAWAFVKVFFEYKFISLFSLLFGAGIIVQWVRAERSGRGFTPLFARRMLVLAAVGLAHGFLLWYGDILFVYACLGLIFLLCRRFRPRTMLIIAGGLIGAFVGMNLLFAGVGFLFGPQLQAMGMSMTPPPMSNEAMDPLPAALEVIRSNPFDFTGATWMAAETRAFAEGPWIDAMLFRSLLYAVCVAAAAFGFGWHSLAMFFIGATMIKTGFFDRAKQASHRRAMWLGLGFGLPTEAAMTWLQYVGLTTGRLDATALAGALHEVGSLGMCLGLVGGMCLLVSSGRLAGLCSLVQSAGRLGMTNYLLQTVVATAMMNWWGLGWFGEVSRLQQIGLVLLIYPAQLALSALWLRAFTIGPLEWLWRSLTYWRLQPLRRAAIVPVP